MIKTTVFQITSILADGQLLPNPTINNGTDWLREAINTIYNRNKGRLKAAGVLTNLFHNHDEQSGINIARYPLIQYQKQAEDFFVVGLNEGCHALETLFCDELPVYNLSEQLHLKVKKVFTANQAVGCTESKYSYTLNNWLPFSNENYKRYKAMGRLSDKLTFLENTLKNHLVKDFSKYLELGLTDDEVKVDFTAIDSFTNSTIRVRVNKHIHGFQPFTITFTTNVKLPRNICLGNGKVYGFGLINDIGFIQ